MINTISKIQRGKKTLYSANQVYNALGLNWRGRRSLPSGVVADYDTVDGVNQYLLSEQGIKNVCKTNKKDASIFGFSTKKSADNTKQINKLESTIHDMKVVLAQILTANSSSRNCLPVKGISARLIKFDPLQVQARRQIREIVQDYASKRANELGITDDSRRLFFDLSFKALYNAYKDKTPNKIDLKAIADKETEDTSNKVSGLQIAERLGLAIELLQFTKSFYKLNN